MEGNMTELRSAAELLIVDVVFLAHTSQAPLFSVLNCKIMQFAYRSVMKNFLKVAEVFAFFNIVLFL